MLPHVLEILGKQFLPIRNPAVKDSALLVPAIDEPQPDIDSSGPAAFVGEPLRVAI